MLAPSAKSPTTAARAILPRRPRVIANRRGLKYMVGHCGHRAVGFSTPLVSQVNGSPLCGQLGPPGSWAASSSRESVAASGGSSTSSSIKRCTASLRRSCMVCSWVSSVGQHIPSQLDSSLSSTRSSNRPRLSLSKGPFIISLLSRYSCARQWVLFPVNPYLPVDTWAPSANPMPRTGPRAALIALAGIGPSRRRSPYAPNAAATPIVAPTAMSEG